MQNTVNDRNGRGDRALLANDRLDAAGHVEIAGVGHSVGDDRRFKRNDRRTARLGGRDFIGIFHRQGWRGGFGHDLSLG